MRWPALSSVICFAISGLARLLLSHGWRPQLSAGSNPRSTAMFALPLIALANRFHHEVLVPAWYWGGALFDGACYLAASALPRR
jgi:hypothetical protein